MQNSFCRSEGAFFESSDHLSLVVFRCHLCNSLRVIRGTASTMQLARRFPIDVADHERRVSARGAPPSCGYRPDRCRALPSRWLFSVAVRLRTCWALNNRAPHKGAVNECPSCNFSAGTKMQLAVDNSRGSLTRQLRRGLHQPSQRPLRGSWFTKTTRCHLALNCLYLKSRKPNTLAKRNDSAACEYVLALRKTSRLALAPWTGRGSSASFGRPKLADRATALTTKASASCRSSVTLDTRLVQGRRRRR